jgi:hypothetical protein
MSICLCADPKVNGKPDIIMKKAALRFIRDSGAVEKVP